MFDIDELDDDPEIAFAQLARRYEEQYVEATTEDYNGNNNYEISMTYMVNVLAAASALGLDMLSDWEIPDNDISYYGRFNKFRLSVQFYVKRAEIGLKKTHSKYSVGLSQEEKNVVYGYIDKMRSIFEQSSLANDKLTQLLVLLGDLRKEVELNRTRFARVADTVRRIAGLTADVEETAARPLFKYIKAIFGKFDDAKEEEQRRLPRDIEAKKLPPPPKRLEAPKPANESKPNLDSEIPF